MLDESLIRKAPAYLRVLLRSARNKMQGLLDRRDLVVHVSPQVDTCKTPYHSFRLLWIPPPRRLLRPAQPRSVRVTQPR